MHSRGGQEYEAERSRLDWRRSYDDLRYGVHTLPEAVQQSLLSLMDVLHLEFGAIDMILQPDGQYTFLECNSQGQFYWIEAETGLPICAALAELLAKGKEE